MKVWMRGRLAPFSASPAAIDVLEAGAGEAAHGGVLDDLGDFANRFEIAGR